MAELIARSIADDPPFSVREAGFIRDGYNAEVDRLREIQKGGTGFLAQIEAREKERTGIRTLKVKYNKVFGYYIEVSNSFKDQVPADYIRKQTLVNAERYITQELKDLEHTVLTAKDQLRPWSTSLFRPSGPRSAPRPSASRPPPPPWRSWTPCAPLPPWR